VIVTFSMSMQVLCFDAAVANPAKIASCSINLSSGRNDMAAAIVGSEVRLADLIALPS